MLSPAAAAEYEVWLIRTAWKVRVQRKALAFVPHEEPTFLEHLRDAQPSGAVHYRFRPRGGGYDRNITDPRTAWTRIDYHNPVRRGLVKVATDSLWSSARFYAGWRDVPLGMGPLPALDG